jgi:hypothetical protein
MTILARFSNYKCTVRDIQFTKEYEQILGGKVSCRLHKKSPREKKKLTLDK